MMATDEVALSSLMTGQEVATALYRLEKEYPQAQHPDEYLVLELIEGNGSDLRFTNLNVRLKLDGAKTVLADKAEILHCTTDDGREVSIELGTPAHRATEVARLRIEN